MSMKDLKFVSKPAITSHRKALTGDQEVITPVLDRPLIGPRRGNP